jgi:hypothetical protein
MESVISFITINTQNGSMYESITMGLFILVSNTSLYIRVVSHKDSLLTMRSYQREYINSRKKKQIPFF